LKVSFPCQAFILSCSSSLECSLFHTPPYGKASEDLSADYHPHIFAAFARSSSPFFFIDSFLNSPFSPARLSFRISQLSLRKASPSYIFGFRSLSLRIGCRPFSEAPPLLPTTFPVRAVTGLKDSAILFSLFLTAGFFPLSCFCQRLPVDSFGHLGPGVGRVVV